MKKLRAILELYDPNKGGDEKPQLKLSHLPNVHEFFNGAHNAAFGEDVPEHDIHADHAHKFLQAEEKLKGQKDLFGRGWAHGSLFGSWSEGGFEDEEPALRRKQAKLSRSDKPPSHKLIGPLFAEADNRYYGHDELCDRRGCGVTYPNDEPTDLVRKYHHETQPGK